MRSRLLSLLAVLVALAIIGSAGASTVWATATKNVYWYGCVKRIGGEFTNSECANGGAPNEWEAAQLPPGERLNVRTKRTSEFELKVYNGESKEALQIKCSDEQGKGWIENPTGGAAGTGSSEIVLSECLTRGLHEYEGCQLPSTLTLQAHMELIEKSSVIENRYTPASGTDFTEMKLENCEDVSLDGSRPLTGAVDAEVNHALEEQQLIPTPAELSVGGDIAQFTNGVMRQDVEEGGGGTWGENVAEVPTVSAVSATNIRQTEAKVEATLSPNGSTTHYKVDYGTTASYGKSTSSELVGSSNEKVSTGLSGLSPSTVYHYRVEATSAAGTTVSQDKTFETPAIVHWYGCVTQTGGHYDSSTCQSTGSAKTWETKKFSEGEKANLKGSGGTIVLANVGIAGVKGTFTCESQVGGTWVENPAGGSAGIGHTEIKYKACTIEGKGKNWSGCKVSHVNSFGARLELLTIEKENAVKLTPENGKNGFAEFVLEGCTNGGLNGANVLRGAAYAFVNNTGSALVFNGAKELSGELEFAGSAWVETTATITLSMESGGGDISVAP